MSKKVESGFHMLSYRKKIAVTGGKGRFASILKNFFNGNNIFYLKKNDLDILNFKAVDKYLKRKKINILVHLAGMSRPMVDHEKDINKSIELNIIGTSNIVRACNINKTKLIYISTNYVYPCVKGPYREHDALLPFNKYGWSKLGAESAVRMYKNSLIVRVSMTEKPFIHKSAFTNVISNFMFHDEFAKSFSKIINKKGIINVGGKRQSIYNFAKKFNKNIKMRKALTRNNDQSMNVTKFNKIIFNEK